MFFSNLHNTIRQVKAGQNNIDNKDLSSGVFSTGAMGAMAPVILRKRLIAPAVSTRNGKILLTLGTRNIKILNTPLNYESNCVLTGDIVSRKWDLFRPMLVS